MSPALHIRSRPIRIVAVAAVLMGVFGLDSGAAAQNDESGDSEARECRTDDDCPDRQVCHHGDCVELQTEPPGTDSADGPDPSHPLPDDGGADEVCGADRRCRIQRLKARNRARRHYNAARVEEEVRREVETIFEEKEEDLIRRELPWSVFIQNHPWGAGLLAGRTFADHFRPEFSLVYRDRQLNYTSDRDDLGHSNQNHSAWYGTVHGTYLPSRSWFSPLLSVGFGIGRGEYGFGNPPTVVYHFLTAAVGAEAQFDEGFVVRMAYRYGRLLYNQVKNGPGNYDDQTRQLLEEYMHDEALRGIDVSFGWAF